MLDIAAYLERINHRGTHEPSYQTLCALHRAHLLTTPFENLDIHLGRPIKLDEQALFTKIVERRRGGFCYELNGLFAKLLRELGFDVTLLSARVARETGGFGPEFDHLALLVRVPQPGGAPTPPLLADVGFGDSFSEPLQLEEMIEQVQDGQTFRVTRAGAQWMLQRRNHETWQPQYIFTLEPRAYSYFADMCHYHQSSPQSNFTKRRICSRATPDGRVTISNLSLIITANGERVERQLADEAEFTAMLRDHFQIDLDHP